MKTKTPRDVFQLEAARPRQRGVLMIAPGRPLVP